METIEKLLSVLHDDNIDNLQARVDAVTELSKLDDPRAEGLLIELLNDRWTDIQASAARALGEMRSLSAVGPLCSNLSTYTHGREAAEALVKIGEPAVEQVASVLAGEPDIVEKRETAAVVLGLIGGEQAIAALIEALRFPSPVGLVGQPVELALIRIGAPAVELLAEALRGGALNAADVLVKIGTHEAIGKLVDALEDEKEEVRSVAALALASDGYKLTVEQLITQTQSTSTLIRSNAAEALGKIDDPRVVAPLVDLLKDKELKVNSAARRALGSMRANEKMVNSFLLFLRDPLQKVRAAVTNALCNADSSAVDGLITALFDSDVNVRRGAARALGYIGDTRGVEPLRNVLGDQDMLVRKAVETALKKLVRESDFKNDTYIAKRWWQFWK